MKIQGAITEKVVASIEALLDKGDRVEIIPTKDGIKVVRIKREVIKL